MLNLHYEPCMHAEMMYSRKPEHKQFRHKYQNSLSQLFWKSADKPKPGKDQHLVKIKTARPEISYAVLHNSKLNKMLWSHYCFLGNINKYNICCYKTC